MSDVIDVQSQVAHEEQPPPMGVEPAGAVFPEAQQRVTLLRTFVDLAARIAGTEFVPKGLRGKPAAVLACILTGQEMGIGPMQSLSHIHIVDGKPTQSAELMRAQIMRAGHRFSIRKKSNEQVVVWGQRSDTGEELEITWTLEDAKRAGLIKSGGAWVTYPRAMLMARATSELARDLFADTLGGVSYTPEELGAEVLVTEGGFIDVASIDAPSALPSGEVLDPTAAWDRVNAMKPREVMEELKARGLPAIGSVDVLRGALAEALAGSTAPAEAPQDAPAAPEAEVAPDHAEPRPEAPTATQDAVRPDPGLVAEWRAGFVEASETLEGDGLNEALRAFELSILGSTAQKRGRWVDAMVSASVAEWVPVERTPEDVAAMTAGVEEKVQAARQARRDASNG